MPNTGRKRAAAIASAAIVAVMGFTGNASAQEETCVGPIDPTTEPGVAVPAICIWSYSSPSETEPASTGARVDGVGSASVNLYPFVINVPNVEPPPDEHTIRVILYGVGGLEVHFYPSTDDPLFHNGVCVDVRIGARDHEVCTRDVLG